MKIPAEGKLLRIIIGEQDEWHGKPLYETIIHLAKKEGMAGATAVKGFTGVRLSEKICLLLSKWSIARKR